MLEKHKLAEQMLALINDLLRDKGLMLRAGTVVDAILIAMRPGKRRALDKTSPVVKACAGAGLA